MRFDLTRYIAMYHIVNSGFKISRHCFVFGEPLWSVKKGDNISLGLIFMKDTKYYPYPDFVFGSNYIVHEVTKDSDGVLLFRGSGYEGEYENIKITFDDENLPTVVTLDDMVYPVMKRKERAIKE